MHLALGEVVVSEQRRSPVLVAKLRVCEKGLDARSKRGVWRRLGFAAVVAESEQSKMYAEVFRVRSTTAGAARVPAIPVRGLAEVAPLRRTIAGPAAVNPF